MLVVHAGFSSRVDGYERDSALSHLRIWQRRDKQEISIIKAYAAHSAQSSMG